MFSVIILLAIWATAYFFVDIYAQRDRLSQMAFNWRMNRLIAFQQQVIEDSFAHCSYPPRYTLITDDLNW